MNNFTTLKYFRLLSFMLMISAFLPVIFANLPPVFRSHHIWTIAWFASLVFIKMKILQQNLFQIVLLYGLVIILILLNTLWDNIGEWNENQIIMEFYEIAVAISVIVYYRMEKDYVGLANLVKWTMFFFLITAIMSFVSSLINPMYARDIIGASAVKSENIKEQIYSYQKYGGGGFSFVSALVCVFPLLIYNFKHNSVCYFSKKYILLLIATFLIALFSIKLFANILLAIIIITFSWFGAKNIKRGFFIILVISAIILVIPASLYIEIFQTIASWFNPDSELYYKFNDLALYFATGGSYEETGIGGRAARYPLLWESFQANPLLGHYLSNLSYRDISEGGHLFWMHKLAVFGLLGTIPFLYILYKHIKINLRYFDKEYAFYFLLSLFAMIALGLMKRLGGREFWYTFFIIVPGFYYLPLLKKKKRVQQSGIQNTETVEPAENST